MMDSGDGTKTPPKCSSVSSFGESFRWRERAGGSIFNLKTISKNTAAYVTTVFLDSDSRAKGLLLDRRYGFGKHGENDEEGTALADRGFDPHTSLMRFDNGFDNCQTQT